MGLSKVNLRHLREPFSGLSHLLGALLTIPALIYMSLHLPEKQSDNYLLSYLTFSISMFLLFSASAVYHLMEVSEQRIRQLKRIDHIAIFIMIAGTYTPYCLIGLNAPLKWFSFAVIWGLALVGIGVKIFFLGAPRWLSTLLYVGMGWVSLFIYQPLSENLSDGAMNWLLVGGLVYTIGAVVYATKWPNIHPKNFNFHDFWHLFVLGGAACHFVSIAVYL